MSRRQIVNSFARPGRGYDHCCHRLQERHDGSPAHLPTDLSGMTLDDRLTTADLARRPDHAAENGALVALAAEMAASPATILQKLADSALELCAADSAGVSVLEAEGGQEVFRWRAAAGAFAPHLGGTMPRHASPCGVV